MTLDQYISKLHLAYIQGNATEHTYRGHLKELVESLVQGITATNEPKRQKCGAPDYILTRKDIPVGFIEAKDIGDKDLKGEKLKGGNKEQFDRYKASLGNIIFTDYVDFYLYRENKLIAQVSIGEVTDKGIKPLPDNFDTFTNLIKDFCTHIWQTIANSQKLAEMMASKARLLAEVIEKAILSDEETQENSSLHDQMLAFKEILIHDITPKGFADVYAQTIAYGMFAARLHDKTLDTFSRQKAYDLIPKTNPFLKKLFGYIAGLEVDDRIKWIVDSLVDIFLACNVQEILQNYGKGTRTEEPVIHFYETFLSEYDASLRKARGVWYTPAPVVNFIVRAVDDILKTEFGLPKGLADNSKTQVNIRLYENDKRYTKDKPFLEQEVHRVQILDPATGTGTFLAEVVKHIHQKFKGQQGIWSSYVEQDLLPRLNGFELLMASYAMAHLQLDLLLTETGYTPTTNQRLKVFLTNSLEEPQDAQFKLAMAQWLSEEGKEANKIKRETPVMCIIGNPPYAVSSSNKSVWIENLLAGYKQNLNERNIQPLSDDYIKFIRFGQHFIDKNGSGVLAYISNNSFIDGLTHRQMRKHLLESFDKIYILDLHGSAKKNESTLEGGKDENVFNIMQGVSINIFVKTGKKKAGELGKVYYNEVLGKRSLKYDFLSKNGLRTIQWQTLMPQAPYYFFVKKNFDGEKAYEMGFGLVDFFKLNSAGIKSHRDDFVIDFDEQKLAGRIKTFFDTKYTDEAIVQMFALKDNRDWKLSSARRNASFNASNILPIDYRPFDKRYIYYDDKLVDFTKHNVLRHVMKDNFLLMTTRQQSSSFFRHAFVGKGLVDMCSISLQTKETTYAFPLYVYPESSQKHKKKALLTALEKDILRYKLAQAKEHYAQISKFFYDTVLPFYEAIPNPSVENTKLFEENKSIYEEAKATVEKLEAQLNTPTIAQGSTQKTMSIVTERIPNLNKEIVTQIAEGLGLTFTPEKEATEGTFAPIDLLDYIYAVLHSPTYREKYKEFLKIDFPRVPYPKDAATFWAFVKLGGELRKIHLLESPAVENYITQYPIDGDNTVGKVKYQNGKVYINDTQYFDNVPQVAWEFYIGGYQPAQKWLKDRKERSLDFDDISHYHKIIVALTQTDRIMKEIDTVIFFD